MTSIQATGDQDVLKIVQLAATLALQTQSTRHAGLTGFVDASKRLAIRLDGLETSLAASEAKNVTLEERMHDISRAAAERAQADAGEVARVRREARDQVEEIRRKTESELTAMREVAEAEIARIRDETEAELTTLRATTADLHGRLEIERFDRGELEKALNILLATTNNTARALQDEESLVRAAMNAITDRLGGNSPNLLDDALKGGEVIAFQARVA